MKEKILKFQKNCFREYLVQLQKEGLIPNPYLFPFGNPIRPIVPVQTELNKIMIIGAFPSARFEFIHFSDGKHYLIPVANNLSPFGEEKYFDGQRVRVQESRKSLNENYFSVLKINSDKIWLTDIVKVYLMPEKHIKNCRKVNSKIKYFDTHRDYKKIAKSEVSLKWLFQEISICRPKIIITLGEVTARVLSKDNKTKNKDLLNGSMNSIKINDEELKIAYLPHPEIFRRNKEWRERTNTSLKNLANYINNQKINI